jgi:hypothetical protein
MRRPSMGAANMGPSFNYAPSAATEMLPFTREGGWGWDASEGVNGAPFDASHVGGAGAGGGMGTGNGVGMNPNGHYGGGALGRAEVGRAQV